MDATKFTVGQRVSFSNERGRHTGKLVFTMKRLADDQQLGVIEVVKASNSLPGILELVALKDLAPADGGEAK